MFCVVTGTRPEIIKMSMIIKLLRKKRSDMIYVHSGQHYDYVMSKKFIEELSLPEPDFWINLGRPQDSVEQMIKLMQGLWSIIKNNKVQLVIVQGDTNTTLATAMVANKFGLPVAHVESGLRSFDLRMPEEYNRRLTDHLSALLFAPTKRAVQNLKKENVWGEIYLTGNTIVDVVLKFLELAQKKSQILTKIKFQEYILFTAHRAENVDDKNVLIEFIKFFKRSPLPVVYPIHPRTRKRLIQYGLWNKIMRIKNLQILNPLGYLDFLMLLKNAKIVVTDSGGVVEEATVPSIRKPVLIARLSTERYEAVEAGFARLVGVKSQNIIRNVENILESYSTLLKSLPEISPFGDGRASERITHLIMQRWEAFYSNINWMKILVKKILESFLRQANI